MKHKIGIISIILSLSACGLSTPQGYVFGTTGFLETSYRATQLKPIKQRQIELEPEADTRLSKGR